MRGIFSSAPAPSAIRLLVGSEILLLVQTGLVLNNPRPLHAPVTLIFLIAVVSLAALIAAILGEPADADISRGRTRRGS